jgi:hypothetical protein
MARLLTFGDRQLHTPNQKRIPYEQTALHPDFDFGEHVGPKRSSRK